MSQIKTPAEILQLAKIGQYLAFNDRSNKTFLKGGVVDNRLPLMIACERLCVEWKYNTNPVDSTLRATSSYLYDLLGIYALQAQNILNNLAGTVPVVSGPSNQNVNVGGNATFTITVTSSSSYSIAWFRNGILIPGETGLAYTLNSAQLSDSGAVFSAVVTNSAGSMSSANATLTVTQTITGQAYYGATDYYSQLLLGIDNVPYNVSFDITHNSPFVVNFPSGAAVNMYQIYKVPITESVKTLWRNTISDGGDIPGFVFQSPLTIGSFRYYITSTQISIDYTQPMTLS